MFLQIAAVSPADICYEETLSTLRYAEGYVCEYLSSMVVLHSKSSKVLLLLDCRGWHWEGGPGGKRNDVRERNERN